LDDVLVGAPNYSGWSGRAYVVFGRRRPHTVDLAALRRHGITLRGKRYKVLPDRFGQRVSPLGDINRDGLADVGILASGESRDSNKPPYFRPGSGYVIFGRRSGGSISVARLGREGFLLEAPIEGGFSNVAIAGDMNGDGRADLLAGAPGVLASGRVPAGAGYLIFSPW
jgi:FG-GAP repeat